MFAAPRILRFLVVLAPLTAFGQTRNLSTDIDRFTVRHQTEHYALAGTISGDRFVEYGRSLEYIYKEYAKGFAELLAERTNEHDPGSTQARLRPSPQSRKRSGPQERGSSSAAKSSGRLDKRHEADHPSDRFHVAILATGKQYEEFTRAYFAGASEHTKGLFVAPLKLLIIRDEADSSDTYETLFHEAFHQFVHRYAPFAPTWINEGLATYYGSARVTARGLVFDRPRRGYFKVVRDAMDARKLIPLDRLMTADGAAFYSRQPIAGLPYSRRTLSYAQSYTLVGYILSDTQGRKHLREYLLALAGVRSPPQAIQVTRGSFPDAMRRTMVPPWRNYVNRQ